MTLSAEDYESLHGATAAAYPDRRGDIINAHTVLATISPATVGESPGLTEAVHWLVDDMAEICPGKAAHPRYHGGFKIVSARKRD